MTIRFYGIYREKVGKKELLVDVGEKMKLKDVLLSVGNVGKNIVSSFDRSNMIIFLNGKNVRLLKGLETEVKDGDVLAVFPPSGGG